MHQIPTHIQHIRYSVMVILYNVLLSQCEDQGLEDRCLLVVQVQLLPDISPSILWISTG